MASVAICGYGCAAAAQRSRTMAKGQKKSNKEIRKPKAEVKKTIAANPSTKGLVEAAKR